MTYSSVQFSTSGEVVDGDISSHVYDGTRPADPTAIRVTDTSLHRINPATGVSTSVQKHTQIQMIDHGDTVLLSNGERVSPAVAATLERQTNLRIVPNAPIEAPKEVEVEPTPEHAG